MDSRAHEVRPRQVTRETYIGNNPKHETVHQLKSDVWQAGLGLTSAHGQRSNAKLGTECF
jgi:hypothetical protein